MDPPISLETLGQAHHHLSRTPSEHSTAHSRTYQDDDQDQRPQDQETPRTMPCPSNGAPVAANPADPAGVEEVCFEALPPDLIEHVARWMASPSDLMSLRCVSRSFHDACSAVAELLRRLLRKFPRMEHLLTVAGHDACCQRSLDYEAMFQQQQAADESEPATTGMLRELPVASQPDDALQVTIELQHGDELYHWSGSPVHAIFELGGTDGGTWPEPDRPHLWMEAPAWWDELERLEEEDPEAAERGWDMLRARAYLTRGVHTVKVFDADRAQCPVFLRSDGTHAGMRWCRNSLDEVGVQHCRYCGRDCACGAMYVVTDDEGHFWLEFEGCGRKGTRLSAADVWGLLNLWPFGR